MKKILSSVMLTMALCIASTSAIAATIFEVNFGQANIDRPSQNSTKVNGATLKLGWISNSGLGFELSHAEFKDTENRNSIEYLDGKLNSNTKYEFKTTTLDLVKEFDLAKSFLLVTKIGVSKISSSSDYRENYLIPPDTNNLITHVSYNNYSDEAVHAYIGVDYGIGYSSVTLGADLYKSSSIKALVPNIGVRIRF